MSSQRLCRSANTLSILGRLHSHLHLHKYSATWQPRLPSYQSYHPSARRFVSVVCAAVGAKPKFTWSCSSCGETTPQWMGRCPGCNSWNQLQKVAVRDEGSSKGGGGGGAAAARAVLPQTSPRRQAPAEEPAIGTNLAADISIPSAVPVWQPVGWVSASDRPQRISEVRRQGFGARWRLPLAGPEGEELSRVLGGGVVPGSLTLIGGDPGVGKSTLLLQLAGILAAIPVEDTYEEAGHSTQIRQTQTVLYVSAEESVEQVGSRAERMGLQDSDNVFLYSATRLADVLREVVSMRPRAVIVDSIQTVYLDDVTGSAGSVSQVRECATALLHVAKRERVPIFLVGHVTKQGDIAGPRVLEHIVDAVLYLEGERHQTFRLLRGIKNRYGATDEVGVFTMDESGLHPVPNPSALFLSDRQQPAGVSSAVSITIEGTRPLLVEIQALCSRIHHQGQGPPLRAVNGVNRNRLFQILAILTKYARLKTYAVDIHTNVVGGLSIKEPASDLAVAVAVASSICEQTTPPNMAFVGELGLGGELRPVSHLDRRVSEAAKLGFDTCIVPAGSPNMNAKRLQGIKIVKCTNISSALQASLGPVVNPESLTGAVTVYENSEVV